MASAVFCVTIPISKNRCRKIIKKNTWIIGWTYDDVLGLHSRNIIDIMVLNLKSGQTFSDIFPWAEWAKLFPASNESTDRKRLNAQKYVGISKQHYNPWKRRSKMGERTSKVFIDYEITISLFQGDRNLGRTLNGLEVYLSSMTERRISQYAQITHENPSLIEQFLSECNVIELKTEIEEISTYTQRQYGLELQDAIDSASSMFVGAPFLSSRNVFESVSELIFVLYQP